MNETTFLILHRKSANEPYVKDAIKAVKKAGIKLRVLVPFNKAEKPRVVSEALERGATRIVAGGGDGTINAVANALIGKGKKKRMPRWAFSHWVPPMILPVVVGCRRMISVNV